MKLLAIETATEACSAALYVDGSVSARYEVAPRRHTQLILPMCDTLIAEAGITLSQLDAIAFGRGPGSFTGLRIAAGVVQGVAFAWDLPVLPVSTLATVAQEAMHVHDSPNILATIDARMKELYWGYYRRDVEGLAHLCSAEGVGRPEKMPIMSGSWFGAGTGWRAHPDALKSRIGESLIGCHESLLPKAQYAIPLARALYDRGGAVTASQAVPVYLRDNVAKKSR